MKIETIYLFNTWTAGRNLIPYIYGVTDYIDDQCEETAKKLWGVDWLLRHLRINYQHFRHVFPQHEDGIIGVKFPDEEGPDGNYILSHYFRK